MTLKLVRTAVDLAIVSAIENDHLEAARAIGWFQWKFGGAVAPAAGAFVVAFTIGAWRTRLLPTWLAGIGAMLGVAAATTGFAGGFVVYLLGWWFAVAGLVMFFRPAVVEAGSRDLF